MGLFCRLSAAAAEDLYGTCEPCSQCLTDDVSIFGCAPRCPAGPIASLLGPSAADDPAVSALARSTVELAFTLAYQQAQDTGGTSSDVDAKYNDNLTAAAAVVVGKSQSVLCPMLDVRRLANFGGQFCPNASISNACPTGSYCKPQSIAPVACPWIARCPENTTYPDTRAMAGFLFPCVFLVALLAFGLSVCFFEWLDILTIRSTPLFASEGPEESEPGESPSSHGRPYKSGSAEVGPEPIGLKEGLLRASGLLLADTVNVIMGPSGCGKSTLVRMLAGRMLPEKSVEVEYCSRRHVLLSESGLRRRIGYVPQEDVLHARLTVKENIAYSARLTMRPGEPGSTHFKYTNAIVQDLQLYTIRDSVVGFEEQSGISGGERKRVNIGMGMISLPPMLFLDEPTSGLDATSSMAVMELLQGIAGKGDMNIVAVLHQPRPETFDKIGWLLLLTTGGAVVYNGPAEMCKHYFTACLGFSKCFGVETETAVADAVLDIMTGHTQSDFGVQADALALTWLFLGRNVMLHKLQHDGRYEWGWHMVWLIHRSLLMSTRNILLTLADSLTLYLAAFIVGLVQQHECEIGIAPTAMFLAYNLTDLGWIIVAPLIYLLVYYNLVVPRAPFVYYYAIGLLVNWFSAGLAYVVALTYIPPQSRFLWTIFLVLIMGAFLQGLSPSIRSVRGGFFEFVLGLSYNRWAMEAGVIQEFKQYYAARSLEIVSIFYNYGICRMDTRVVDDGAMQLLQ
ncbi:hypothetical protein GPECTOR_27g669 [Gonium pectorale]|uniref:ABC transporter domain-containing protein n=1 Tax=Gonium pectorale TaxID=33097 RepID=A0A150GF69_GONPE|nr:hypothetical protein GPECTOR_27g669 [Gonium pectorale]|eukprot:KXZ48499.1 hypothetical protein GPECTOR_27g669 [Gonium pectorale]